MAHSKPQLAQLLHDADELKPFTTSPLWPISDRVRIERGWARLRAGEPCEVRFTLAGQAVLRAFDHLNAVDGDMLELGSERERTPFAIQHVAIDGAAHPRAGHITLDDLVTSVAPSRSRKIGLRFLTPTSFKVDTNAGEKVLCLPQPEFVFGGLANKWMSFGSTAALDLEALINRMARDGRAPSVRADGSPLSAGDAWRAVFAHSVIVNRMAGVRTEVAMINNMPQIGMVGDVCFEVCSDEPDVVHVVQVLAEAAFYFGVGRKTTQGMGQVVRLPALER